MRSGLSAQPTQSMTNHRTRQEQPRAAQRRRRLVPSTRAPPLQRGFVSQQRIGERLGLERGEIVWPLAETDQLDRDPELALDAHDDAALRGAVELGEHDAGDN